MNLKRIICLLLFLSASMLVRAQHACTATSCPLALPDENIDSIRMEMSKQIKLISEKYTKAELKIEVIKVEDNRYGYQIISDGKVIIEERTIPAIAGYYGFINEEDAKKVAEFAIKKIKEGEMPPSISVADLKELQINL